MQIDSNFEAGSINVIAADDPGAIVLELKDDNAFAVRLWFYFRATGVAGQKLHITLREVEKESVLRELPGMPAVWENFQARASYDGEDWFLVPTQFDGVNLTIDFTPAEDAVFFAQAVPYPASRDRALINRARASKRTQWSVLGDTPDGNRIELLQIGDGPKPCWIITRQHPAETQGSFCIEGLVERLLDEGDPVVNDLLQHCTFWVVPNMNPDGSRRGNTRTNVHGINLNRAWVAPSLETSPEVFLVRRKIEETGCAFALDVHAWTGGHNFAIGPHHVPSQTARQTALWKEFEAALAKASGGTFQVGWTYPGGGPAPGEADLSLSWNWLSETYEAIAILYELLIKDDAANPDPVRGWTPEKSKQFGRATLDALDAIVDRI